MALMSTIEVKGLQVLFFVVVFCIRRIISITPASNLSYLAPPGQFLMDVKLFIGTATKPFYPNVSKLLPPAPKILSSISGRPRDVSVRPYKYCFPIIRM